MVAGSSQARLYIPGSRLILLILHFRVRQLVSLGIVESKAQRIATGQRAPLIMQVDGSQSCLDSVCLTLVVHIAIAVNLLEFTLQLSRQRHTHGLSGPILPASPWHACQTPHHRRYTTLPSACPRLYAPQSPSPATTARSARP